MADQSWPRRVPFRPAAEPLEGRALAAVFSPAVDLPAGVEVPGVWSRTAIVQLCAPRGLEVLRAGAPLGVVAVGGLARLRDAGPETGVLTGALDRMEAGLAGPPSGLHTSSALLTSLLSCLVALVAWSIRDRRRTCGVRDWGGIDPLAMLWPGLGRRRCHAAARVSEAASQQKSWLSLADRSLPPSGRRGPSGGVE